MWSDIDLDYSSESDFESDMDEFSFLDAEDYDAEDSHDFDSFTIDDEALVFHDDFRHSKNIYHRHNRTRESHKNSTSKNKLHKTDSFFGDKLDVNDVMFGDARYEIVYNYDEPRTSHDEKDVTTDPERIFKRSVNRQHKSLDSQRIRFPNATNPTGRNRKMRKKLRRKNLSGQKSHSLRSNEAGYAQMDESRSNEIIIDNMAR